LNKWLTILLLLYGGSFVSAQAPPFSFRNIGINDGLSQNSVVDIAVDQTGFLWLATQDGLNRFDGKDFLVFNKIFDDVTVPSGNKLGKIITGNNNDLWMITSGGRLEKMNLYNHSFESLTKLTRDSIVLPPASSLYLSKNNELWIGTENNGLFVYALTGKSLKHYTAQLNSSFKLSDNHIQSIFTDSKNNYWLLTKNGVTVINPVLKETKQLLHSSDSSSLISYSAIDEDEEGTLWLGSFGKGLFYKKKGDNTFIPFTGFSSSQTIPSELVVYSIKTDREGRIWIGSYGNGLYLINKKDSTIQNFKNDKRKPFSHGHNDVLCIKQDTRGGIWIGSDGGGLSYYHNGLNNFSSYTAENLPDTVSIEQVRSILVDKYGSILAGTSEKGLFYRDPQKAAFHQLVFKPYKKSISNPNRVVSLLCDGEGDIWVGTQANGLMILDGKTKKIKKWFHPDATGFQKIPDHTTWCMQSFQQNKVLAGTLNNGLCIIDKQKGFIKNFSRNSNEKETPGFNNVRAMVKISDSLYCIGYERKGIQFLNIKTGIFETIQNESLNKIWREETILKCLFYHPPFLLMGTQGKGIIVYDRSSEKVFRITEEQGLSNNTVYGILEDKQGWLWLSSNKGLSRFRLPQDISSINRSCFNVFSAQDGLQSNEFNTGASYEGADGTLYFGGIKGLNFFNPANFTKTSLEIPVVITQVNIKNSPFSSDTIISYKKKLQLKYHENSVSFNYAGLAFFSHAGLQYLYRLSGYDNEWINAGNRNYAAYTNLLPGDYYFEVKSYNQTSNEYGPITRIAIQITPPYWQRWWFIISGIFLFMAVLYALYRYRVNQLIQMQNVRSRIATDLHDDIGSTLTNINILTELSKKNIDHKREAEIFLNRIAEEANISSQALDDIVWSINKENDTIEQTVARMRRYAAEIFEAANINYSLQSDQQIAGRKLNMETRRDFYLLFKESVNNIYKHAKATNVEIKLWVEKKNLQLQISDDGKGFDTAAPTHRNGIKGIHTRVKKWKGHADIRSEPGKGTIIHISLPVS
jgi:ligand-binding sensor domain-containing protein/two-component sensor histidine kinase